MDCYKDAENLRPDDVGIVLDLIALEKVSSG
jgi:hypothetical protein